MGSELPHQNLLLTCKPYWGWADLQTTIALQANNYWFGGANDYSFHIRTNSRLDMKPLLIRWQTTIAIALYPLQLCTRPLVHSVGDMNLYRSLG